MTRMVVDLSCAPAMSQATMATRAHGVVVSHPLRMRKALGSNPSVSILPHRVQCIVPAPGVCRHLHTRTACGPVRAWVWGGGLGTGEEGPAGITMHGTPLRWSSGAGAAPALRRSHDQHGRRCSRGRHVLHMRCGRTPAAGWAKTHPAPLWLSAVHGWHPRGCEPRTPASTIVPVATLWARRRGTAPHRFRRTGAHTTVSAGESPAWQAGHMMSNHALVSQRAHGVVVSHPLRMRKALGSNPSVPISCELLFQVSDCPGSELRSVHH